jgi:hypothetical protein
MSNLTSGERVSEVLPYSLRLRINVDASVVGIAMDGGPGKVLVELSSPLQAPAPFAAPSANGSSAPGASCASSAIGIVKPFEPGASAQSGQGAAGDSEAAATSPETDTEFRSGNLSRRGERHFVALGLIGLSGVFLANAATAFAEPAGFISMVRTSVFGTLLTYVDSQAIGLAIGVNDVCLGVALLVASAVYRLRGVVFAWTGIWLLLVTLIKLSSLGLG